MNRYPDMGVSALNAAIAERYGVEVDRVASGTGSVAVLYHLLQATCQEGDEVVYAWRSFEAYPIAVGLTGATDVQVPLTADARHDLPGDAGRHHRPDQGRGGLLAQQPHRPVGAPRRARGVPRRRSAARAGRHRRGLPRVRDATPRRRMRSRSRRDETTSSCCGRSRRPTAWPACGSASPSVRRRRPRPSASARCPSASRRSPRRPPWPPSRPRPTCSSGWTRSWPSATGSTPGSPTRAGRCQTPRATSSGWRSATTARRSRPPARRSA